MCKHKKTDDNCDYPEIRDSHGGKCPKEQQEKCHGKQQEKDDCCKKEDCCD